MSSDQPVEGDAKAEAEAEGEILGYPQPTSFSSGENSSNDDDDDDDKDAAAFTPTPIPIPMPMQPYRYLRYEHAESAFFPDGKLPPETLVWVLLSKGKKKVPKIHKRARVVEEEPDDAEGRILVRYPNDSTYRVRRKLLIPVFEHLSSIVLVAAETNDYRRMSIVHTRKEDHFIEIGCDFGILVDGVDAKSSLGIDKSEESIKVARTRYPDQRFLRKDVFEDELEMIRAEDKTPLVVSIDINGNRELPAVLRCIQFAMDSWSPRLIMVKSRELHAKMVREDGDEAA